MKRLNHHLVFAVITFLYLVFCFATYKDYGITADEELNYTNGKHLISYLTQPTTIISVNEELDKSVHSPLFDSHNRLYSALISMLNTRDYYEWFHLLNLLFAYPLFALFYYLIYSKYHKISYAIFAVAALFLTPRFLGHIPANPKDIPFAVIYFISLTAIYRVKNHNAPNLLLLGILFGIAQSVRTVGFTLYILYAAQEILMRKSFKQLALSLIIIFLVGNFVMASTWAFVGANYFRDTLELFEGAYDFAPWNKTILFMGKFLTKYERPMQYLPVWFLITTPLYVVAGALTSLVFMFKNRLILLLWLTVFINSTLYLTMNPVIYNGLRHYLYILPVIVLLALLGIIELLELPKVAKTTKSGVLLLVFVNFILVINSIIKLHPYEYVYFNEVTGGLSKAAGKFEMDYWGASYKESADWLKTQTYSKVYSCNLSFAMQYYSHGKYEMVSSQEEADYMVCDFDSELKEGYTGEIVYQVIRQNVPINTVRSVRNLQ